MNQIKTSIRTKENKRRLNFAIKLILLILLEYFLEADTFLDPILEENLILKNIIRAFVFLLSANLIISLGRIIMLQFYLQNTAETKVLPNFVVGIGSTPKTQQIPHRPRHPIQGFPGEFYQ